MAKKGKGTREPTPPIAWRKHGIFAAIVVVGVGLLAWTGGGRDADRAEALAAGALTQELVVDGAVDPAAVEAWTQIHGALGSLLNPLGIDEKLPLQVRVDGSERQAQEVITVLARAGVRATEPGRFHVGQLEIEAARAPGSQVAVTAVYSGPASEDHKGTASGARIAGPWWSVLPPLLAVLLALFYRRVLIALTAAVMLGAALVFDPRPDVIVGETLRTYFWGALSDSFKLYVIAFTVALVGMIQVAARSGGNQGLIDAVSRLAKNARSTRLVTAMMGLVVFFDDYANSVIVGTSARPLTDKRRISREKLAYLVDSTAAPVAGIAIISTWVGYEVGLFDTISSDLALGQSGFEIFLNVLPTRFYCFLALAFVFVGAFTARDYGPMLKAEQRALSTGDVGGVSSDLDKQAQEQLKTFRRKGITPQWYNAAVPVVITLVGVVIGVGWDGSLAIQAGGGAAPDLGTFDGWQAVFSNADSGKVLFFASITGSVVGIAMVVAQGILSVKEALGAWFEGAAMMREALAILLLAWCIQAVTKDLGTSFYLVSVLEPVLHPSILPIVVFLAAAAVAFATGTSWGTMGILLPALIPLAWVMTGDMMITLLCMGAVLDGAIFGDHCSPISDTTVMSSIASGCDHIEHVRTQLPYAMTVMVIAAVFGYLARPLGIPTVVCYLAGFAAIVAVFMIVGTKLEEPSSS